MVLGLSQWIANLVWLGYVVLVLACLLTALFRKKEPSQALGWSLAIVFIPVFGPLAFVLFGCGEAVKESASAGDDVAARAETLMPEDASLASLYEDSCFSCHSIADSGAPLRRRACPASRHTHARRRSTT